VKEEVASFGEKTQEECHVSKDCPLPGGGGGNLRKSRAILSEVLAWENWDWQGFPKHRGE